MFRFRLLTKQLGAAAPYLSLSLPFALPVSREGDTSAVDDDDGDDDEC